MIQRLLIANRGEIACRIIKTAQHMGITTLAIYTLQDANTPHVRMADEAWLLKNGDYLDIMDILAIAQASHADAIHPGYGFLSENPAFVDACERAHLCFIGPSKTAMQCMASKKEAKQLLAPLGVPLIPGYHGQDQSLQALQKAAEHLGFPVLLKAAMGGGGKGMRIIHHADEFEDIYRRAQREAFTHFQDDTLILEKYIAHSKHLEIQIIVDHQGHFFHAFERDCSIQRRHQKIIEEAPALQSSPNIRAALIEVARTVAHAIDYRGVGTIEFLYDLDTQHFYFMEMNTRLQVEHPVTEMILNLDLVACQIHIANQTTLPFTQETLEIQGHAIECRVYAEDPSHDFKPSIGTFHKLWMPPQPDVRVEASFETHDCISSSYDALISKVIAWGPSRDIAIVRLHKALASYHVAGVRTNLTFLQRLLDTDDFKRQTIDTQFLTQHPEIFHPMHPPITLLLCAIAASYPEPCHTSLLHDLWGFQPYLSRHTYHQYRVDDQIYALRTTPLNLHHFSYAYEQTTGDVFIRHRSADTLRLEHQGKQYQAIILTKQGATWTFLLEGQTWVIEALHETPRTVPTCSLSDLKAPMSATVVALLKKEGDDIQKGEALMILEAMKMEHTIYAPTSGRIEQLCCTSGAHVKEGTYLAHIEPFEPS